MVDDTIDPPPMPDNDITSPGNIAKEIRARVADLNELLEAAAAKHVLVKIDVLHISDFVQAMPVTKLNVETFMYV